jgi:hypothetical protein
MAAGPRSEPLATERTDTGGSPASSASIGGAIADLAAGYRAAAATVADLAVAEARLASATVLRMALILMLVATALVTAWVLTAMALAVLLAPLLGWIATLALLATANLLCALACLSLLSGLAPSLTFPTLRSVLSGSALDTERPG